MMPNKTLPAAVLFAKKGKKTNVESLHKAPDLTAKRHEPGKSPEPMKSQSEVT